MCVHLEKRFKNEVKKQFKIFQHLELLDKNQLFSIKDVFPKDFLNEEARNEVYASTRIKQQIYRKKLFKIYE